MRANSLVFLSFLILALAALVLGGFWMTTYTSGYRDGLDDTGKGPPVLAGVAWLLGLALWLTALCTLISAFVVSRGKRQPLSITRCAFTVTLLVAIPLAEFTQGPGGNWYTAGFRDGWRKRKVDYDAIRAWRRTLADDAYPLVRKPDLPTEIAAHHPNFVSLDPNDGVTFWYGGGFGHWGITIYSLESIENGEWTPSKMTIAPGVDAWSGE